MPTETETCISIECECNGIFTYSIEEGEVVEIIPAPQADVAGPGAYVYGTVLDYPTHVAIAWHLQMSDNASGPWEDTGSTTTFNDGQFGQFGDDPHFGKWFRLRYHTTNGISQWSTNPAFR